MLAIAIGLVMLWLVGIVVACATSNETNHQAFVDGQRLHAAKRGLVLHEDAYFKGREIYLPPSGQLNKAFKPYYGSYEQLIETKSKYPAVHRSLIRDGLVIEV